MSSVKRKQLFIDPRVQSALIRRILVYWFVCLVAVGIFGTVIDLLALNHPIWSQQPWNVVMPIALASCLMLPLIVLDMLRLSNRFAGPMYRFRKSLRALAKGERVEKIYFREGDLWQGLSVEFNALVERLEQEQRDTSGHVRANASVASTSSSSCSDWPRMVVEDREMQVQGDLQSSEVQT